MSIPSVWPNTDKCQTEIKPFFFKIRIAATLDFPDGIGRATRDTLLDLFNHFDRPFLICHLPVLLPDEPKAFLENIPNGYFGLPFFNLGSIYNMGSS